MTTHSFKLLTGVECEITPILGEHRDIFINQKNIKDGTNLIKFLHAIIVRIGTKTNITEQDVLNLLSEDANLILLEARLFDNDFENNFEFEYTFEVNKRKIKHPIQVDLSQIEKRPYRYNPNPQMDATDFAEFSDMNFTEYSQVLEVVKQKFYLPKMQKFIHFNLLNLGIQKDFSKSLSKDNITGLTPLQMRKPTFVGDNGLDITLNLNRVPNSDLTKLQIYINKLEGKVDTIVQINNPYDDDEKITLNLISLPDFLFGGLGA